MTTLPITLPYHRMLAINHRQHWWSGFGSWMWRLRQGKVSVTKRKLDMTTALRNFQFDASLIACHQDIFPRRVTLLIPLFLSSFISISVWQRANAVTVSEDKPPPLSPQWRCCFLRVVSDCFYCFRKKLAIHMDGLTSGNQNNNNKKSISLSNKENLAYTK